jgi:RND family efflux transporter MFP subunit
LDVALEAAEELRVLISKIRLMLSNSVPDLQMSQATIDAYVAQAAAAEGIMLGDVSMLNALEKSLQGFKLDRTSQIATADNNRSIANNQLTDASNALLTFQTTGSGSIQDLEVQIEQTGNDLLSAQADFDSAKRGATIQNSAKTLEINTLSNQLRLAQKSLEDNKITSPINGVLSEFTVDKGDYVAPGTYLGKVIQHEQVKVVFYVSEEVAERLMLGQAFSFLVENGGVRAFIGHINRISPSADPINKKIRIEGLVANTDHLLKPEMFVNLGLDISAETFDPIKVYVPMNSIIFAQNDRYVYVVEDGEAVRRNVDVGQVYGMWVEVLQGLSKSDDLIVEGHRNLPPAGDIAVTIVQ